MSVIDITQSKLDEILLPYGITSHHIRRIDVDTIVVNGEKIAVNKNEYVVFRLISSPPGTYGDGNLLTTRRRIDINYYYSYDKTDSRYSDVEKRVRKIIKEFTTDTMIRLANGQSDIYDLDNPYRGINVEFSFSEVNDV